MAQPQSAETAAFAEGMTELAPGMVASVVTYLEMNARPAAGPSRAAPDQEAVLHEAPDVEWYLALYRRVGDDYLWFSRHQMPRSALAELLSRDTVEVWSLRRDGQDLGLLELEWDGEGNCELMFFGLAPELIGAGCGRWLMDHAIERAFGRPISRFFVHTCTLDSPQALGFYIRSGFVPYGRAIEVTRDPRLTGDIAPDRAAHIPLIRD